MDMRMDQEYFEGLPKLVQFQIADCRLGRCHSDALEHMLCLHRACESLLRRCCTSPATIEYNRVCDRWLPTTLPITPPNASATILPTIPTPLTCITINRWMNIEDTVFSFQLSASRSSISQEVLDGP